MSILFLPAMLSMSLDTAVPLDMVTSRDAQWARAGEFAVHTVLAPEFTFSQQLFQPSVKPLRWLQHSNQSGLRRCGMMPRINDSSTFPQSDFNSKMAIYRPFASALPRNGVFGHFLDLNTTPTSLTAPTLNNGAAPSALFARARIKVLALLTACLDWLQSVQMLMLGSLVLTPLLCVWLVVGLFACAVILDAAMAVFGLLLVISTATPADHFHAISCLMKTCMHMISSRLMIKVVRMMVCTVIIIKLPSCFAAGSDQPATNPSDYFLPGMTRWDGIPFHDFRRIWWIALCAALGNVSQDSWSLLQTARNQDQGSVGNPGTAAQQVQSQNRNQRLFGSILNYIEATSWIYRYASANFNNNGRGLFNYISVYGHLEYSQDERTKLENEWRDATMSSVGIRYTPEAIFKWAEYVDNLAHKLFNKSEQDKRVKFLAGFPSSFDVMVVPERARGADGSYVHAANYPGHDPRAGTANPMAGRPDIHANARAFYPEWSRMCDAGMIRPAPRGMANHVNECDEAYASHDECAARADVERAFMSRERITPRTVCGVCGGIGHAGHVDGVGSCLTSQLGNRVPTSDLNQITYPNGYNPPRFTARFDPNLASRQRPRDLNTSSFRERRNSNPHPRARVVEPPPSSDSDEEAANYTSQHTTRTHSGRYNERNQRSSRASTPGSSRFASRSGPRSGPRPRTPSRSTRFNAQSRRRVRHVEEENEDENDDYHRDATQNVNVADADLSDEDEHARLAVSFESIEF